jgi:hypothetical protein
MVNQTTSFKPFRLGSTLITHGAKELIPMARVMECLAFHQRGEWGNVCEEDAEENNIATQQGFRVLSAYAIDPNKPAKGYGDNCLWIITEADRQVTTILLPDEY